MTATQDWLAEHLGPVEIITFTLPPDADPAPWTTLLAAVDAGAIGVLDLEILRRNAADEIEFLDIGEVPDAPASLTDFDGAGSGLLDDEDAAIILGELGDGDIAVAMVVEHLGLFATMQAFEAAGSRIIVDGTLALADLDEALDEAEASDTEGESE